MDDKRMDEKAVAHRSLKHLYGKMLMFLNLFETSETYLAFDKAPLFGCI